MQRVGPTKHTVDVPQYNFGSTIYLLSFLLHCPFRDYCPRTRQDPPWNSSLNIGMYVSGGYTKYTLDVPQYNWHIFDRLLSSVSCCPFRDYCPRTRQNPPWKSSLNIGIYVSDRAHQYMLNDSQYDRHILDQLYTFSVSCCTVPSISTVHGPSRALYGVPGNP